MPSRKRPSATLPLRRKFSKKISLKSPELIRPQFLRRKTNSMRIRAPWICLVAVLVGCLMLLDMTLPTLSVRAQEPQASPQQQNKIVEDVQVEGNRRLRQEDVLYHVQTRKGDVYNPEQV